MARRGNLKFYEGFSWYVPTVKGCLALTLMFLLGAVLGNLVALALGAAMGELNSEVLTLVSYPIMFVPAMMYARFKSRNASLWGSGLKVDSRNFGTLGAAGVAVLVVVMTLALTFCIDAPMSLMPPMPEWLEGALKSMTQGTVWINFLCVSVFAPFFEEWLCRGMVLRGLLGSKMRPAWAIVISSAFFALIHLNPWQALPAFAIGALMGYVYYKTGSLMMTMLMHFANNTLALVVSQIDSLKDYDSWLDMLPSGTYWAGFAAGIAVLGFGIALIRRIPLHSKQGACEELGPVFE